VAKLFTRIIYNTNIQAKKSTIEQNFGGVEELGYVLIHFLFLDRGRGTPFSPATPTYSFCFVD